MEAIRVELNQQRKTKPEDDKLGFGRYFTDHMFLIDYTRGQGWHSPRIVPYGPLAFDPATMVFHYGQTIFEGMKAFRGEDGQVRLFRPDRNMVRLNRSASRMSIPEVDGNLVLEGLYKLLEIDRDWVPALQGTSLYIRPFIMATEPELGVRPAGQYLLAIILSPVGAYYEEGLKPVNIFVENHFARAVRGGTGEAKTAGNYASGLKAQEAAKAAGCAQVLWLDAVERKYVEEVGSMNVFFKINGEVVTPALTGSILDGITRDSVIQLIRHWGIPLVERQVEIAEILAAAQNGQLEEAFGTGTAAVISPIGGLHYEGKNYAISGGTDDSLSARIYRTITGTQYGKVADEFGWNVVLAPAEVK